MESNHRDSQNLLNDLSTSVVVRKESFSGISSVEGLEREKFMPYSVSHSNQPYAF